MAEPLTKLFDTDESVLHEIKRVMKEHRAGNTEITFPIVDVQIPASVIIDCPLVRPMLRSAGKCKQCKHFNSIVQVAWSDEMVIPWFDKYIIRCGFINERKTRQVVVE